MVHSSNNYKYPIKIVVNAEDGYIDVITAYPLRRSLT